jgi:hypothetical protein
VFEVTALHSQSLWTVALGSSSPPLLPVQTFNMPPKKDDKKNKKGGNQIVTKEVDSSQFVRKVSIQSLDIA